MPAASVAEEPSEKLFSPDNRYSVEVLRNSEDALLVRQSGKTLTKISTEVGPADSTFEALWSPDQRYLAINKQRSSRPGGDEMWIVALPSGKVLRQPDDDLWNELEERESVYIDEKTNLNKTGGKEFLTLTAMGWDKGGLRFRLDEGFGEIEDRYFFEGTVDPLNLRMINDWKVSHIQGEAAPTQIRQEGAVSKPVSADVEIPAAHSERGIKAGDIKITFSDGHTEVVTKNGICMHPHVSGKGDVGWTQCTEFNPKGYAMNEKLVVRLANGAIKEFKPHLKAPFISNWTFVDNDSGVLIQSMSFHGPQSYIRYDLATGKMTNQKYGTNDAEPLPRWAQPLGD